MTRARLFPAQWRLAIEVLDGVVHAGRAADRLLQTAFREHRQMGGRDRARVTELVYGSLRDWRRLQRIAQTPSVEGCVALHALDSGLADAAALQALGVADAAALARRLRDFDAALLSAAERLNAPDAIYAEWSAQWGPLEAERLAEALRAQAPVDLRVNTLKATPTQARQALAAAGIDAEPAPYAPQGLRLQRRAALQATAVFRDGWIEPQDEGSQLLALLVAARPGERVVDFCAGAGGKTLALAAQMQNRGELLAFDSDAVRLRRLRPRLERAGVTCVQPRVVQDGDALDDLRERADAVLVDAPCSGTGTWRRQPEARMRPLDLPALSALQARILARAARLVRPGGRLVYATCSLLRAENEAVVEGFLADHPDFAVEDAGAVLRGAGVDFSGPCLALYPHRHGTDGFFGACLRRRPA